MFLLVRSSTFLFQFLEIEKSEKDVEARQELKEVIE